MTDSSTASDIPSAVPRQKEKTWGMLAHLSAFAGLILPLGSILGPLAVWLLKRDQSGFVGEQGKEALNFNISVALAALVCWVLVYVFIGILLGVALFIYWMAATILAGIKAGEGAHYRHRLSLRLIK